MAKKSNHSKFDELKDKVLTGAIDSNSTMTIEVKNGLKDIFKIFEPFEVDIDLDMMPEILRNYAKYIMSRTGCSSTSAVLNILSTVSCLLQKTVCFPRVDVSKNVKGYYQKLYPHLWIMDINRSGSFKTTSQNFGHEIARKLGGDIEIEDSEEGIDSKSISSGQKKGVFFPQRMTWARFIQILSKQSSGLILSSEFGVWLKQMSSGSSDITMRTTLTDLYDSPLAYKYSTKTDGTFTIEEPCISICGATTISQFESLMSKDDISSGFLPRFLLFTPRENKNIPDALPRYDEIGELAIGYSQMFDVLSKIPVNREYSLDSVSRKYFEETHTQMYNVVLQNLPEIKELLLPFLRRWSPYILKVSMVLEFIRDPLSQTISKESIEGAAHIVACAYDSTKWLIERLVLDKDFFKNVVLVFFYILSKGGSIERKQLQQSRVVDSEAMDAALKYLGLCGKIEVVSSGSKSCEIYQIKKSVAKD